MENQNILRKKLVRVAKRVSRAANCSARHTEHNTGNKNILIFGCRKSRYSKYTNHSTGIAIIQ
jgi:hypothetical protein